MATSMLVMAELGRQKEPQVRRPVAIVYKEEGWEENSRPWYAPWTRRRRVTLQAAVHRGLLDQLDQEAVEAAGYSVASIGLIFKRSSFPSDGEIVELALASKGVYQDVRRKLRLTSWESLFPRIPQGWTPEAPRDMVALMWYWADSSQK